MYHTDATVMSWIGMQSSSFFNLVPKKKAGANNPLQCVIKTFKQLYDFLNLIHALADQALLFHFGMCFPHH